MAACCRWPPIGWTGWSGCRPALGDAARDGLRLVQVLIEPASPCPVICRRAGLRAMRNLTVFRPADASEALECLELALRRASGPSVLLLSDQPAKAPLAPPDRVRASRGGHVAAEAVGPRAATLVASGPELGMALATRAALAACGVQAAVVSLPCWTLFAAQDPAWIARVLGSAPRIGIESGSGFGWERWLGPAGLFVAVSAEMDAGVLADIVARHLNRLQAN